MGSFLARVFTDGNEEICHRPDQPLQRDVKLMFPARHKIVKWKGMIRVNHRGDTCQPASQSSEKARLCSMCMHQVKSLALQQFHQAEAGAQVRQRRDRGYQRGHRMKYIRAAFGPVNPVAIGIASEVNFEALSIMQFGSAEGIVLSATHDRKRYQ